LRAEIARLKAELTKKPAGAVETDAVAIAAAEQRGFQRGFKDGFADANAKARQSLDVHRNLIGESIKNFCASITHTLSVLTLDLQIPNDIASGSPTGRTVPAPTRPPVVPPAARSSSPAARGDGNLSGPQQRILNSLATWAQLGEHQPNNAQVAWLAGYSPSSTSYTNPRSTLKSAGLIDYPAKDQIAITVDGKAAARPFELSGSLLDFVLSLLPGPEARILRSVANHYPHQISNDEAATGANYSASSTSYTNPRSALRTKDLISYPAKDQVRAADWLFDA
jgi:hypothetical protein